MRMSEKTKNQRAIIAGEVLSRNIGMCKQVIIYKDGDNYHVTRKCLAHSDVNKVYNTLAEAYEEWEEAV